MARLANNGDITISKSTPTTVPMNENTTPTPNALAACPFSAKGRPSKQVATEDGVPGIFNSIAEIKPPEIPPIYNAINIEIPCVDVIVYVTGRNITIAIVAVKPGIEPNIIPTMTPIAINNITKGSLNTFIIPPLKSKYAKW